MSNQEGRNERRKEEGSLTYVRTYLVNVRTSVRTRSLDRKSVRSFVSSSVYSYDTHSLMAVVVVVVVVGGGAAVVVVVVASQELRLEYSGRDTIERRSTY